MRFMGLDLNLLYALHILLEERSVTRAARRLHISQPAMSAALARLRKTLGDDIFVPVGNHIVPTAHAESLAPMVAGLVAQAQSLVLASTKFDASTSTRCFRLRASDYITAVLIVPLLKRVAQEAPGIQVEILGTNDAPMLGLERGEYDLLFSPRQFASPDHPTERIFMEQHVIAGWIGNPVFRQTLTERIFLQHGHIIVEFGTIRAPSYAERMLTELGYKRRVEVVAPSFCSVPALLPDTMRLTVMHARLAEIARKTVPIALAPLPFAFPPMEETVQYHKSRAADAGLRWLLDRIMEVGKNIPLPEGVTRRQPKRASTTPARS